jgi:putative nucleotidyltransferase with HDIG domain
MTFFDIPIENIEIMPSIPSVLNKLLNSIDNPRISNKEISKIIMLDPSLTTKVLSFSNSASMGSINYIDDVGFAVTRIGRREIKNIALTIFAASIVNRLQPHLISLSDFWHHSLATAFIARKVARHHLLKKNIDESHDNVYISGLLHDLGLIFYDILLKSEFEKLIADAKHNKSSIYYIERKTRDSDHAQEGANLLKFWKLPDSIIDEVKYHHHPKMSKLSQLNSSIVNVANYIANLVGYRCIADIADPPRSEIAWNVFDFSEKSEEELIDIFDEFLKQSQLFLKFSKILVSN